MEKERRILAEFGKGPVRSSWTPPPWWILTTDWVVRLLGWGLFLAALYAPFADWEAREGPAGNGLF